MLVGGYVYDENAEYTVTFCDQNGTVLETVTVKALTSATCSTQLPNVNQGGNTYKFANRWVDENGKDFNVNYVYKSVTVTAVYEISGV